ncbi:glutaredoxin family protein [Pengzhenrongella frigida]|uniref:Glutaredoxin family protein n=1 Tax=Pengzhenrongella frigida TaxID=1259133 RepID=A0A4Q5MWR5_9MICO|nr:glutaredoxin family protein [Cellulomonas sp. HLT2-17]RYV50058.1 glutaredoxin family protein [Cellulomonas sp. HLT2-17]
MGDGVVRVVLYVRAGCHLCEAAREVVSTAAAAAGTPWVEIDVDAAAADDGGALQRAYGEEVPVVVVDGVTRGFWRIDAQRLAKALREPR